MKSLIEQFLILENIQEEGNVVLVKLDGERSKNKITVLIDFPRPSTRELIQFSGDNLNELLHKLISEYNSKDGI